MQSSNNLDIYGPHVPEAYNSFALFIIDQVNNIFC